VANGADPNKTVIRDVMTHDVATVTPDTDISQLTGIMSRQQIRRVPVVENNTLVGIVSLGDLATDSRFDTEASEALADISMPSRPAKPGKNIRPSNR
jgi:signal-transduction protein with cAMP-binding, CBS, and nucleotidyltransferase domain